MTREPLFVIDRVSGEKMIESVAASNLLVWMFASTGGFGSWLGNLIAGFAPFSKLFGLLARTSFSKHLISRFIAFHKIKIQDFQQPDNGYDNFEAFFSRALRKGSRPLDFDPNVAIVPADGRYRFFDPLDEGLRLWVKGKDYSIKQLLGDKSSQFKLAPICVARLAPFDYHRFHSPIEGKIVRLENQEGSLFSVHPWSLQAQFGRLFENKRTLIEIEHPTKGSCLVIAVGATCVGSIELFVSLGSEVSRGQEIGCFHFGGSSLILIMEPRHFEWSEELLTLFQHHAGRYEILCKMGQPLTKSCKALRGPG